MKPPQAGPAPQPAPFERWFRTESWKEFPVRVEIATEPSELEALARHLDVPAVHALRAHLRVDRAPRGRLAVTGSVEARLVRTCVVSLEPFDVDVREPVEILFAAPPPVPRKGASQPAREVTVAADEDDPPEPIIDGRIDLGSVACEFLALGLDPHPRKPGISFEAPAAEPPPPSPFQILARLRDKPSNKGDE